MSIHGIRWGFGDFPNDRSSHTNAIPKGGGVGLLATCVLCSVLLKFPLWFTLSATIVSLISFYDDKNEISPLLRLCIQFSCSMIFFIAYVNIKQDFLLFALLPPLALYIVGTTNLYNFMDGINGIAALTGIIAFCMLALYGHSSGTKKEYVIFCLCISFACVGFLPFNLVNAKVFMGDVGSILLGYLFAIMAVLMSSNIVDFICMTGFLFMFYADEITTMVVRIRNGDQIGRAHRKHIYQLLVNEHGIKHWTVSLLYSAIQIMICLTIIVLKNSGAFLVLAVLLLFFLIFYLISIFIRASSKMKIAKQD